MTGRFRVSLVIAFITVLVLPYALRPAGQKRRSDAQRLVIIAAGLQTVWYEFERAFSDWHERHHGTPVDIDWRSPGGSSAIHQFLNARYSAVDALNDPNQRGIGIDLLFGGGYIDHEQQKRAGHTEPCGIRSEHPELLSPDIIPPTLAGAILYDRDDHYYGFCLTLFGILANTEAMARQGIPADLIPPRTWRDLGSPRLAGKISMADPAQSGSVVKVFEIVIQQEMRAALEERRGASGGVGWSAEAERGVLGEGFWRGMRLTQRIAANSRRITRTSAEAAMDVLQGDSLAAMCVDYYGLTQAEIAARPDGSSRVMYFTPPGGAAGGSDPVSLLRGAPHPKVARRFIHFCLTPEGQRLWCYRVGAPGGPVKYTLHRPPIRRDMYTDENLRYFANPDVQPYAMSERFAYRPEWTGPLYNFIRVFLRAMCMDTHNELREAWAAMVAAGQTEPDSPAMRELQAMPALTYASLFDEAFRRRLRDPVEVVNLSRDWSEHFRRQYRKAATIAREQGAAR
mgnify:CR=1 FL=1